MLQRLMDISDTFRGDQMHNDFGNIVICSCTFLLEGLSLSMLLDSMTDFIID